MNMRIYRSVALALFIVPLLLVVPRASAQNGQLSGQVFDLQGKPYPDVTVTISNKDTGSAYTVKTDKEGKFLQLGIQFGNYKLNFKKDKDKVNYDLEGINVPGQTEPLTVNFKDIAAKQGVDPEAAAKAEAAKKKFTDMKTHFDTGRAALTAADALKQQIRAASADQLADLLAKRNSSLTTAISEFQQAQQAAPEKDSNLPTILGNLGLAYDGAGEVDRLMMRHAPADQHDTLQAKMNSDYDQAVANLQKAADLKPTAAIYFQLGTELANTGKIPEASAACDKGATLDPTGPGSAENCYRNIGIVLSNQNKMKDAVAPLQKATQMNPKDAEAWFLLGSALTNTIETKQEGAKMIYIIPPGTAEAYQKYLELEPNGPNAADAKGSLEALQQMGGGLSTKVNTKKKN
jgi:tetratricopeptide (TPR) repeat protein